MRLSQFKLCPFSRTIRLVLAELGADPVLEEVRPWAPAPEFLTRNPAGTLPTLDLDTGLTLCGAYPIVEFIAAAQADDLLWRALGVERAPDDVPIGSGLRLIPGDRVDQAEVRRIVDWFHHKCDREVTQELLFEKVRPVLDPAKSRAPNAALLRAARANLRYHLSYVGFLSDQRRWLAGDEASLADLAAAAHLSVIDYLGEIVWAEHPSVQDWYQRVKSRKSFRSLLADQVPGFPPPAHYRELDF